MLTAPWDQPSDDSTEQSASASQLFQSVADALPHGLLAVRADGTITLVNQRLAQDFGFPPEELVGQSIDTLIPDALQTLHTARANFAKMPQPRRMEGVELSGRHRDGSPFPVEIKLTSVAAGPEPFLLAAVVNLTSRKEAEHAIDAAVVRRIVFEREMADLSVQFIGLPATEVIDTIRTALERLGEALAIDLGTFCRLQPNGDLVDRLRWERAGRADLVTPEAADPFPWMPDAVRAGQMISFDSLEELEDPVARASYRSLGIQSGVALPLVIEERVIGALGFSTVGRQRAWPVEEIQRFRMIASVFAKALARRQADEAVTAALAEVELLRERLQEENVYLQAEAEERLGSNLIVGQSRVLRDVLEQIQQVAVADSTVLLLGETGTGKELFASRIHELSTRRKRSMIRVNCSAIPDALMESELFGREQGAFTGALARQVGRFELADRSTIFLDEIGDLPLEVQVKLLRVLEERQLERLGSPQPIRVDTRVIAATHHNLEQQIADGMFREDLFYRLNVFPIRVPPLRERLDDIPLLVWRFVTEFSAAFGKRIDAISRADLAALQRYAWPGNIRELRNIVERAMIVATGPRLAIPLLDGAAPSGGRRSRRLVDVEKDHIKQVLEATGWRIRGAGGAADRLGLRPTTLETRLGKLGLKRPKTN